MAFGLKYFYKMDLLILLRTVFESPGHSPTEDSSIRNNPKYTKEEFLILIQNELIDRLLVNSQTVGSSLKAIEPLN